MNTSIELFLPSLAFASLMLASGELRASGRRTGKGKAGKGAPKSGSPSGAAAWRQAGARQSSKLARHALKAPAAPGGDPSRRVRGSGGSPAEGAAGNHGGVRFERDPASGPGPAGLPEAPPWEFPSDGGLLDGMISEFSPELPQADCWCSARAWEILRGVSRACLGDDDPRVPCATSRVAHAVSHAPECLEAAAALAAGAAELFSRASSGTSGDGERPSAWPRAREEKFALDVLRAIRAEIARTPGRAPDAPFPAPAYRLSTALFPGPASPEPVRPGPEVLRAALAAAELDGAGSAEALSVRSRLGEAVADAEAWARASVTTLFAGSSAAYVTSGAPRLPGLAGTPGPLRLPGLAGTPGPPRLP
jgi:hypothetical protein